MIVYVSDILCSWCMISIKVFVINNKISDQQQH